MPRVPLALGLLVSALVSLAALGCAHADRAADRHASEMREQLTKIQADQDRLNQRLGALEIAAADERAEKAARPPAAPAAPPPPPRTKAIGDVAATESEDPGDPAARPEIRLVGPPGAASRASSRGKSGRVRELRADADDDEALRADGLRPSALDPDAKRSYESALALVQGKHYERGLEALAAFLVRWPDHPYAENAIYWRGEAYFAQGEYLRAAEQFEAALARFPGGSKGPDALFKIGMCHDRLGSGERAKEYWDRLKRDYPKSEAAKKVAVASSEGPKKDRGRTVK